MLCFSHPRRSKTSCAFTQGSQEVLVHQVLSCGSQLPRLGTVLNHFPIEYEEDATIVQLGVVGVHHDHFDLVKKLLLNSVQVVHDEHIRAGLFSVPNRYSVGAPVKNINNYSRVSITIVELLCCALHIVTKKEQDVALMPLVGLPDITRTEGIVAFPVDLSFHSILLQLNLKY